MEELSTPQNKIGGIAVEGPIILQLDVKDFFPNWEKMTPKEQEYWKQAFAVYQNKFRRRLERWTNTKRAN